MTISAPLASLGAKFGAAVAKQIYDWSKGSEAKRLTDLLKREHPAAPRLLTQPDALAALWDYATTGRFERDRMVAAVAQVEHGADAAAALVDAIESTVWRTKTDAEHVHFEVRKAVFDLGRPVAVAGRVGDPVDLGIATSVLQTGARGKAPHVRRDVDALIAERLGAAIGDAGVQVVMVEGERLAGRSHAAAHALTEAARGLPLYRAQTPAHLRSVLRTAPDRPAVVWIDPAEPVFDRAVGGVAEHEIAAGTRRHPLVLLAVGDAADDRATAVRRAARGGVIPVERLLREHELKRLRELRIDEQLVAEIAEWGLGTALSAAPHVIRAYRTRWSEDGCAFVDVVLGWRTLGMRHPLDGPLLRRLWSALEDREDRGDDDAAALRRLVEAAPASGQALLRPVEGGWAVHPALEQLSPPGPWRDRWRRPAVTRVLDEWAEGDPGRLASYGVAATRLDMPDRAQPIFETAIALGSRRGRFNLAALLFERGDSAGALGALDELRTDIAQEPSPAPELQALLADTWLAIGVLHEQRGQLGAAARGYEAAAALGHPSGQLNLAMLRTSSVGADTAFEELSDALPLAAEPAVARLLLDDPEDDRASALLGELLNAMPAEEAEGLGRLLERIGRLEQARRAFEAASDAGRLPATAQLGALLLHAGDPTAIAVLRQAAGRGSRAALLYLGRALALSEPAQAREVLSTAHQLGSPTAGVELLPLVAQADPQFASRLLRELDPRALAEHRPGWSDEQRRAIDELASQPPSGRVPGARRRGDR